MTSLHLRLWVASCLPVAWCAGGSVLAQPVVQEDQHVPQAVSQTPFGAQPRLNLMHRGRQQLPQTQQVQQLQQLLQQPQLQQPPLQQQAQVMQPQVPPTQMLVQQGLPVQQMAEQWPQLLKKGAVPESLMEAVRSVESQIAKARNAQELFQATLKQELEAKNRAALARKRVAAERLRLASSRPKAAQLQFEIDNSRTVQRSLRRENAQLREELARWRAAASNSVARDAKVVDLLSSHMTGGGDVHAASMFLKTAKPFLSLAPLQPKDAGSSTLAGVSMAATPPKGGMASELPVKQDTVR